MGRKYFAGPTGLERFQYNTCSGRSDVSPLEPTMTIALRQGFVLWRLDGSVTYQVTPVSPESANARMPSDMRSLL